MSASIVLLFFGLSLVLYVVTGGADFGVGILELFAPKTERESIRKMGEHAIAPIWEANHIWLILALVILFVGFPTLHVRITTYLHIPLLIMLTGIILRGTAFTFRYYDIEQDPTTQRLCTVLFRGGSVLVPMAFGHIVASLSRGMLPATPTNVWDSYWGPWIGAFPMAVGVFTTVLFGWLAVVFLLGEIETPALPNWSRRAKRWTLCLVLAGCGVATTGWLENVPWIRILSQLPAATVCVLLATLVLSYLWYQFNSPKPWTSRFLAGVLTLLILGGYWGAHYPKIIELNDGTTVLWSQSFAPEATLNALATCLVVASFLILPGLFWLFKIFRSITHENQH